MMYYFVPRQAKQSLWSCRFSIWAGAHGLLTFNGSWCFWHGYLRRCIIERTLPAAYVRRGFDTSVSRHSAFDLIASA